MIKNTTKLLWGTVLILCVLNGQFASGQTSDWDGQWITNLGPIVLTQNESKVTGKFDGTGKVKGAIEGKKLKCTYTKKQTRGGELKGEFVVELGDDSRTFSGTYSTARRRGKVNGWKALPADQRGEEPVDFSGHWLSSWGNMVLKQDGKKVSGHYGSQGLATLKGKVNGRRLELVWTKLQWSGDAWIELTEDGKRIYGTTVDDDPTAWIGLRASEFSYHPEPKAGEIVKGYADNGMLYHLRMPDDWKAGEKTDLVVLLHGSYWTTAGMVFVTAKNWPEIGKKYAILGIQGEQWADWSGEDDLRHNYTYQNWMGRSTYKGFPYTDRESPSLVMEMIDELDEKYSFARRFIGGHSQGGFLTHVLHMHFADKIDGTFPIAGGMIIQAEPDVFEDEDLIAAQKETPMALVHGKRDNVVPYSTGQYVYNRYLSHDFGRVQFIRPNMGHPYDFLPVNEAISYLDVMTTDDADALQKWAEEKVQKKEWRAVGNAIERAKKIKAGKAFSPIWKSYEAAAKKDAAKHMKAMKKNQNGKWVDGFLQWQEQFGQSNAAKELNKLFAEMREAHAEPAKENAIEARKAFNSGKAAKGWELNREIVEKYYASTQYRTLKKQVEKHFGK